MPDALCADREALVGYKASQMVIYFWSGLPTKGGCAMFCLMRRLPVILFAIVALAQSPPAYGQTDGSGLSFVGPDSLTISHEDGSAEAQPVWVRNSSSRSAEVRFTALLESSGGDSINVKAKSSPKRIRPNVVERFQVALRKLPLKAP